MRKTEIHSNQFLIISRLKDSKVFNYVHPTIYSYSDAKKHAEQFAQSKPSYEFIVVAVAAIFKATPVEYDVVRSYRL